MKRFSPLALGTLLILLIALLAPLAAFLWTVPPSAVLAAYARPEIRSALGVSLGASLLSTGIAACLGIPAGYYLAGLPRRVAFLPLTLMALPPAFPPVASGIMLLALTGAQAPLGMWLAHLGVTIPDSYLGVVAAEFFVSASFVALAAYAAFSSLDPRAADAVRTLGVGEARIFWRVALPQASGMIAAGIAFAWLRAIGEYGATSILAYHPASLPIALSITLAARGVVDALALCAGFVALAGAVLVLQYVVRRRIV